MAETVEKLKKKPRLINSLLKDELLEVAKFLQIEVSRAAKKAEIKDLVERSLIEHEEFEATAFVDEEEEEEEEKDGKPGDGAKGKAFDKTFKEFALDKENERRLREVEMKLQYELQKEKLYAQIKLKELEVKLVEAKQGLGNDSATPFDITKNIRLVPAFNEDCVDKYFTHFENSRYSEMA